MANPIMLPREQAEAMLRQVGSDSPGKTRIPGQPVAPPSVVLGGGEVLAKVQVPQFATFDEMYQALPEDSWYDPNVSPTQPVQFEIGSYQVPQGLALWVFDYEFIPYRMSGQDPGDLVPVEDGRFSTVMGFDYVVGTKRPKHTLYQLDPVPVNVARTAFQPQQNLVPTQRASADQFNRNASQSFAATSGQGLSLLPTIHRGRQGTLTSHSAPFTIVIGENDRAALNCVILRRVPIPLGGITARHMGYLVQAQLSQALLQNVRP